MLLRKDSGENACRLEAGLRRGGVASQPLRHCPTCSPAQHLDSGLDAPQNSRKSPFRTRLSWKGGGHKRGREAPPSVTTRLSLAPPSSASWTRKQPDHTQRKAHFELAGERGTPQEMPLAAECRPSVFKGSLSLQVSVAREQLLATSVTHSMLIAPARGSWLNTGEGSAAWTGLWSDPDGQWSTS